MNLNLNTAFLTLVLILSVSCGSKSNNSASPLTGSALLEQQCADNNVPQEAVTIELKELQDYFVQKAPIVFFNIPEKNYDYKSPMVINLQDMQSKTAYLKTQISNEDYLEENLAAIALDVYFEYQKALRYEGMKCSKSFLATKKANDITPYMSMKAFCLEKNDDESCTMDTLLNLSLDEEQMVIKNNLTMCKSLTNDPEGCQQQYSLENVTPTQKSFKKNFYDSLFALRSSHLKFNCEQTDDLTVMNIKVLKSGFSEEKLKSLTDYVSEQWSRNNFQLSIELVSEKTADVIELIPTNRTVSYVPDNNNRQVYLSQILDSYSMKRVLVHEFGHVLGFPDCYTEFYDTEKNSLIYYEISQDNTNIMCSLKSGVSVPEDYMTQLTQKSCIFN